MHLLFNYNIVIAQSTPYTCSNTEDQQQRHPVRWSNIKTNITHIKNPVNFCFHLYMTVFLKSYKNFLKFFIFSKINKNRGVVLVMLLLLQPTYCNENCIVSFLFLQLIKLNANGQPQVCPYSQRIA